MVKGVGSSKGEAHVTLTCHSLLPYLWRRYAHTKPLAHMCMYVERTSSSLATNSTLTPQRPKKANNHEARHGLVALLLT